MIGGNVLDSSVIGAFGRDTLAALHAVHELDMASQAIIVPMAAMAEGLTSLDRPEEVERAMLLLEIGVVISDDLTADNVESVTTVQLTAKAETSLGMAHAAFAAHERGARVVTLSPERWQTAHPGIEMAEVTEH